MSKEVFIPSCHKPPNKFVRYYEVFREKGEYNYWETRVIYIDKKGIEKDEQYVVKWVNP